MTFGGIILLLAYEGWGGGESTHLFYHQTKKRGARRWWTILKPNTP
jgi:hypothetical protein